MLDGVVPLAKLDPTCTPRNPPAVVMQPTGGVIVNESDSAIIYCTYEANPYNVSDVLWYHEDDQLAVPTAGKYESSSQGYPTLTVRNVRKDDRGMYSCSLANSVGRGNASNYAEVNVLCKYIFSY
ncbi:ig-like domain-containing protein [Caerostris extrusa]|uniref:Ig-like domain-containing protein n=1 Tax=Caerostris extrusa TaxID=172846 RepID=A0AAV4QU41_CAEEX|nr:ig-like domain-containing protein [Caerostris extrusa]